MRDRTGAKEMPRINPWDDYRREEQRQLDEHWEQRARREARLKKRIEDGTLTTEEWQWEIYIRDNSLKWWKQQWHELMDAIGEHVEEKKALRAQLQALAGASIAATGRITALGKELGQ